MSSAHAHTTADRSVHLRTTTRVRTDGLLRVRVLRALVLALLASALPLCSASSPEEAAAKKRAALQRRVRRAEADAAALRAELENLAD